MGVGVGGESRAVGLGVGVSVGIGLGVVVGVKVEVGVGTDTGVGVGSRVGTGEGAGVGVGAGAGVGVGAGPGIGVGEGAGVGAGAGEGVVVGKTLTPGTEVPVGTGRVAIVSRLPLVTNTTANATAVTQIRRAIEARTKNGKRRCVNLRPVKWRRSSWSTGLSRFNRKDSHLRIVFITPMIKSHRRFHRDQLNLTKPHPIGAFLARQTPPMCPRRGDW